MEIVEAKNATTAATPAERLEACRLLCQPRARNVRYALPSFSHSAQSHPTYVFRTTGWYGREALKITKEKKSVLACPSYSASQHDRHGWSNTSRFRFDRDGKCVGL